MSGKNEILSFLRGSTGAVGGINSSKEETRSAAATWARSWFNGSMSSCGVTGVDGDCML